MNHNYVPPKSSEASTLWRDENESFLTVLFNPNFTRFTNHKMIHYLFFITIPAE